MAHSMEKRQIVPSTTQKKAKDSITIPRLFDKIKLSLYSLNKLSIMSL